MAKNQSAPAKSGDFTKMVTSTHRIAFAHADAPYAFKGDDGEDQKPKYSITLIIPENHSDVAKIVAIMKGLHAAEALSKFKGLPYTSSKIDKPLRDGDEYADVQVAKGRPEEQVAPFRGAYHLKVTSLNPVVCFDEQGNEILDIRDQIYSGCYVRAEIKGVAWEQKGNAGFSFYLNSIKKTKDGPRMGGYTADVAAFDEEDETDYSTLEGEEVDGYDDRKPPVAPVKLPKIPGRIYAQDANGADIFSDDGGVNWDWV